MSVLRNLKHLRRINSVDWRALYRTLLHLYPDYFLGAGTTRSIVNITLELTYRCNWRCGFCFLNNNYLNRQVDELGFDELIRIVDEAAPHRMSFYITGGEPFVRKDCIDIIREIKKRKLKVGVNTNSHILNQDKIDELKEIGLDYLISSIHGPKEIHDKVTGVTSYDKAINNLLYWKSKPCRTAILINYVITPETSAHMNHIIEIAAEAHVDALTFQQEGFLTKMDIRKHDTVWESLFDGAHDVELSYLDSDAREYDVGKLAERIKAAKQRAKELGVQVFFKPDLGQRELENWYSNSFDYSGRCSYIYTDARINPRGDVITCQVIPKVAGNIREGKLLEIINSQKFIDFRKGIKKAGGLYPACARCCKLYRSL